MIETNVGHLLSRFAAESPSQIAVAVSRNRSTRRSHPSTSQIESRTYFDYETATFGQLDQQTDRIAAGLIAAGARPGMRLALLVRPGLDFIRLVFALFKTGVITVLIDPGMGRKNMVRCLSEAQPDGFVAIPMAQAVRTILRARFPRARLNITVGRRWFWGGWTLRQIEALGSANGSRLPVENSVEDPAAIIFTTGSTGPPKGVLYLHKTFLRQVEEIRDYYHIRPGGVDISGFPLFALFNGGMGVTTVVPQMDFTRPADVDPNAIIGAVRDWQADQSFGSPALWTTVGRYCDEHNIQLPSLKRVLTAGAPVPPHVLGRLKKMIAADGEIHTPYGATEALPVASIDGRTVLEETAGSTEKGKGTCVGHFFPGIKARVIEISDEPLLDIDQVVAVEPNQIGELIVQGDVVTREYVTRTDANQLHKVADGEAFWHRMGDLGYVDDQGRFWFCGRKGHRVQTTNGVLYTVPCEAVFNAHPAVYRSALVGWQPSGKRPSDSPSVDQPVIVIETWPETRPETDSKQDRLRSELLGRAAGNPLTQSIQKVLFIDKMPVDIRHNSKIFREKLRPWVARQLTDAALQGLS